MLQGVKPLKHLIFEPELHLFRIYYLISRPSKSRFQKRDYNFVSENL
jgi:hypothetical protein